MKKFLLGILVGLVLTALTLVTVFFAMLRFGQRRPVVPENSVLTLRLEGEIPESPRLEIPLPFFERSAPPTVADTWRVLREAAGDSRIKALLLMPQDVSAGWGKLTELHEGVLAFRKSGKPVYAYLRAPTTREYYIATAADRIYMAQEDWLDMKGLRAELLYLGGTMNKLGVEVEIAHAGKYKDAGDTLTRTSASAETREVMNSVLDELYMQMVEGIAKARRQTPEQVKAAIDEGPFLATQALEKKLIDGLLYEDQALGELQVRLKQRDLPKISGADYARARPSASGARIAFVVAEGAIVRGDSGGSDTATGQVSATAFNRVLRQVREDSGIKGVIVRIDSPGGDGFASDEILREMKLLSQRKPVVISMSDTAASGGYFIAMTGDPVVAYPGTLTGSIGVLYGKANLRGLYQKLGVSKDVLTRGRFAAIDSDYAPLTPEGRKKLQESIDEFYRAFVNRVAEARNRKYEEVAPLAEGRVWLGSQAKRNGLVDGFGGIDRAIELVKERAKIGRDEKVRLSFYPPRRNILEELLSHSGEAMFESHLPEPLRQIAASPWLTGGLMKAMPYTITIR